MKLEDMGLLEKVNVLEGLIARTELETEYSIDVEWLENPEYMKREVKVLIDNCRRLFKNDSIKKLDSDIVADASLITGNLNPASKTLRAKSSRSPVVLILPTVINA